MEISLLQFSPFIDTIVDVSPIIVGVIATVAGVNAIHNLLQRESVIYPATEKDFEEAFERDYPDLASRWDGYKS